MVGIGDCNDPHEPGIPSRRESLARVDYVPALCTHRPSLLPIERFSEVLGLFGSRITLTAWREDDQTVAFRGSKSRNKVSVGEPAEGSLPILSSPRRNLPFDVSLSLPPRVVVGRQAHGTR